MTGLVRRLPAGSRFATVSELFEMALDDPASVEQLAVWVPGAASQWMPVEGLLQTSTWRTSLGNVPSGLVVVVKPW